MLHNSSNEVDILVVGAGPVGLLLAHECVRRGLRSRIIEAQSGQSIHSKALAIFPRTLEIFDMAGLASDFLRVANRVRTVAMMSHERALARIQFEPDDTPYPFVAMVPQNITEDLLVSALRRRNYEVEYNTRFVSMEPFADGVSVTTERNGREEKIRAAFVVGCDGAHSSVRKSLGIKLDGGEYDLPFMLADIETVHNLAADELQLCSTTHGPVAIFPMSAKRCRIVATVDQAEGEAPTLEFTQRLLAERAPKDIQANKLYWSSYFRIHHRHASRLRKGRVFIAGDAAHIHSPFGGQGMNTGLHDIWNLVWKLELVLHGYGGDALLESYSEERLPIIQNVIETTDRLTKALGTPSALAQILRESLIPIASHVPAFRHAMVERLSGLGLAYGGSLIHSSGKRVLEDCMRDGQLCEARFFLLVAEDVNPSCLQAANAMAASLDGRLLVRQSQVKGIRLVRPDGYAAFCTEESHDGDAMKIVHGLLSKMLKQNDRSTSNDSETDHAETSGQGNTNCV